MLKMGNVEDVEVRNTQNFNISREMLKMLMMLKLHGDIPPPPKISPATSTSSTFPGKCWSFAFHLQHFPNFKHFFFDKCLKQGKCWRFCHLIGLHLYHMPCSRHFSRLSLSLSHSFSLSLSLSVTFSLSFTVSLYFSLPLSLPLSISLFLPLSLTSFLEFRIQP